MGIVLSLTIPQRPHLRALSSMGLGALVASLALAAGEARAVPAFAVQTGQACNACHVGGFGPQLTPYGREFKLRGYTTRMGEMNVPLSIMAVTSYVRTDKDAAAPPANGFERNDNTAVDQVSLFLAGGLGSHLGAFVQTTYDGVGKTWTWDNLDLRAVAPVEFEGHDLLLGASLNNNPAVQDAWNTTPAWGYPYTSSALAPAPGAAPLLAGGLAQNSLGLTAYAWIDKTWFVEAGAYGSPGARDLLRLGADPYSPGDIDGLAPYGRAAVQTSFANGALEAGVFGLRADLHPSRDRSTGLTDRYTDLGLDASYVRTLANGDVVSLNGRYIHETLDLSASCVLGGDVAGCAKSHLDDLRMDASYYWRDEVGFTFAAFDTFGPANAALYPDNRTLKPDSRGVMLQVDGTPWGGGSPLGPRFNLRVGLQYTIYSTFDGAAKNYDGAGARASDNNTLRAFAWFAY